MVFSKTYLLAGAIGVGADCSLDLLLDQTLQSLRVPFDFFRKLANHILAPSQVKVTEFPASRGSDQVAPRSVEVCTLYPVAPSEGSQARFRSAAREGVPR